MRGIARRYLGERARKIKFLLVLIGLCSLCLGGSYTAWAAETHVAHLSSATFQHVAPPPAGKKAPPPAKKTPPRPRPPLPPPAHGGVPAPSAALINGQWICPPPFIAEVQNTVAPFVGPDGKLEPGGGDPNAPPPQYTEACVGDGLSFPCSDTLNLRNGRMQPSVNIIKDDWLSGDAPLATVVGAIYFSSGGHLIYTFRDETYGSPQIIILYQYMEIVGFLIITPSILLVGYEIMVGASTFRYAGSLEGLSHVLLGGLAVAISYAIVQMLVGFETLVAAGILVLHVEHPFPHVTVNGIPVPYMLSNATKPGEPIISYRGIVVPLSRWGCAVNDFIGIFSVPFVANTLGSVIPLLKGFTHLAQTVTSIADLMHRIGQLVLMVLSVVLWIQVFVRIFLLNYYILTGPLAFGCWALPGGVGQRVVRLWCKGFFSVLFVQVLQIFLLTTLPLLLPTLPQIPTDSVGLIQGFLLEFPPILTLSVVLMAPRLLGASAAKAFGTAGSVAGGIAMAVGSATSQMG